MPTVALPVITETRDKVELGFRTYVEDYRGLDPATWPTGAGIRAPERFEVVEWHNDGLIAEYEVRLDSERDTWQVYGARALRAGDDDHLEGAPISRADLDRLRPDYVLEETLGFFERVTRFDRFAVAEYGALHESTPRARTALRRRRGPSTSTLERVAEVYMANIDQKPAEAVEAELGVSRSTADRRIREARVAGLITAVASRGRKPKR